MRTGRIIHVFGHFGKYVSSNTHERLKPQAIAGNTVNGLLTYNTIRTILFRTMNENETLSTLSLAILGLLSASPSSGYDLRKVFMNTPMGVFSSSPGAIYPALKRCEKSGWIRGDIDNSTTLRPRQVFHLTDKGLSLLKKVLSQAVTVEDAMQRPEDLLLRFAFMDGLLSDDEILAYLESYLSSMETYLETLEETRQSMTFESKNCAYLALEQGLMSYQTNIQWARHASEVLRKETRKRTGEEQ